jgi:hypothetical protein
MENKDQYFQHDFNARNDLKIKALLKRHGAAAYSVFWSIVEELHQHNRFELKPWLIDGIAGDLYLEPDNVRDIIDTCVEYELFFKDGESIGCARVERNLQKRQEVKEKRSKAGKASAIARQDQTLDEQVLTSVEQMPTKESKLKEIKLKEIKEIKEIKENKDLGGKKPPPDTPKSKNFIVPDIQDIEKYCVERKNGVDPQKFFDFYQSKGWMVGKNKMKDWRACVRTWEKSDNQNNATIKKKPLEFA